MTHKTLDVLCVIRLRILIFLFLTEPCLLQNYCSDLLCFLAGRRQTESKKYLRIFGARTRNSLSDVIATDLESHITLLYPQLGFNYNIQMRIVLKELSNDVNSVKIGTFYGIQGMFGFQTDGYRTICMTRLRPKWQELQLFQFFEFEKSKNIGPREKEYSGSYHSQSFNNNRVLYVSYYCTVPPLDFDGLNDIHDSFSNTSSPQ
jgi:hypothetical protein